MSLSADKGRFESHRANKRMNSSMVELRLVKPRVKSSNLFSSARKGELLKRLRELLAKQQGVIASSVLPSKNGMIFSAKDIFKDTAYYTNASRNEFLNISTRTNNSTVECCVEAAVV
jgi:hypothetical protein